MPERFDIERANAFFGRVTAAIARRRLLVAAISLAAVAFLASGLPGLVIDTSQESWFMEGDNALADKRRYEAIFGKGDNCVILARADDLLSPEKLSLLRSLSMALEAEVPYADQALSLTDFELIKGVEGGVEIASLVPDDPMSLSPEGLKTLADEVLSRDMWRNLLLSEDKRESLVSLRLKPTDPNAAPGRHHPDYLIGEKALEVIGRPEYAPLSPVASGIPVIDVEKRRYFASLTPGLIGMSVLIIALAMAVATRDPRAVLFPLAASVAALLSVFGFEGHLGVSLDPTTVFLPVFLALAMSTCYSIHVITRFQAEFKKSGKRFESIAAAGEATGWSLLSSAITTMAGLLSFLIIPMRPLRWVGLTGAALVGAVWLLVFLLIPVFLSLGSDREAKEGDEAAAEARGEGPLGRLVGFLGYGALSRPKLAILISSALAALMLLGASRLEVSFDLKRTYGVGVDYIKRMVEVGESSVGSLYSYGLIIELPEPDMAKEPEILESLKILSSEIEAMPLTKRATSLSDVVMELSQALGDGKAEFRKIPSTREEVAQYLLLYESAGGMEAERWVDYDYQRLKLVAEVHDYNSRVVLKNLSEAKRRAAELFPGARIATTGALSDFTVLMQYITWGQVKTFFLALATITLVMALTFRSLKIALIAMIPNAVPVLCVSGLMGWAGVPLDIMTVTIVPMLLGLAVDDTIHLVNHSLLGFRKTGSYLEGSKNAIADVGKAIALTSIVLVLAFSPYLFSKMLVFSHMGALIAAGILAALAADLMATPAILRLAKAFGPERAK